VTHRSIVERTFTVDQALLIGAQWRSAVRTRDDVHSPMPVTREAIGWVAMIEAQLFVVVLPCLVCGQEFGTTFTAPQMAEWSVRPRGVCGQCAGGESE